MAVELAVPCQCLLTQIVRDSKHALYTVCCRLMLKICAKVGGEPWAVSELPYFSELSIAVGVHITETQVCVVSTLNQTCTRYWSKTLAIFSPDDIEQAVISLVAESLCAFKLRILAFPKYVFLYTTYPELPDLSDLF